MREVENESKGVMERGRWERGRAGDLERDTAVSVRECVTHRRSNQHEEQASDNCRRKEDSDEREEHWKHHSQLQYRPRHLAFVGR